MAQVIVIDDDEILCRQLCSMISSLGHEVVHAHSLQGGLRLVREMMPDVIYLDVNLPDGSGLDILPKLREVPSEPEVIIITGAGDPGSAEMAIKNGAWDYIEKPGSLNDMSLPLVRALQYRAAKQNRRPLAAVKREGIIGDSPAMKNCIDMVAQAASSDVNVLITGETGTGKELFAWAIHENSARSAAKFVVVDCTALPETLVESILFGHERGSFTGADKTREGLIRQADGGTLFLDEAGELPLSVQKTFLRVLQERRLRPLGSRQEFESNFRLIAATNRDLDQLVEEGTFRRDLLFRLRAFQLELPPLRVHPQDIKQLAVYHVMRICQRNESITKGISNEFFEALEAYDWPGNVRELVLTLESAIVASYGETVLYPHHLPISHRVHRAQSSLKKNGAVVSDPPADGDGSSFPRHRDFKQNYFNSMEKKYLHDLLILAENNIARACDISGLSRPRLYALLSKHNISR
jgi:two-component system, NtrC family, response regulator